MIPYIRSIEELMVLTYARSEKVDDKNYRKNFDGETNTKIFRQILGKKEKVLVTKISHKKRINWHKGKRAIKKFFDKLDYNNHNISTYDLTLIKKQDSKNYYDAA